MRQLGSFRVGKLLKRLKGLKVRARAGTGDIITDYRASLAQGTPWQREWHAVECKPDGGAWKEIRTEEPSRRVCERSGDACEGRCEGRGYCVCDG